MADSNWGWIAARNPGTFERTGNPKFRAGRVNKLGSFWLKRHSLAGACDHQIEGKFETTASTRIRAKRVVNDAAPKEKTPSATGEGMGVTIDPKTGELIIVRNVHRDARGKIHGEDRHRIV